MALDGKEVCAEYGISNLKKQKRAMITYMAS